MYEQQNHVCCRLQALFLVPTTAIMHNFWDLEEHTAQHQIEVINFMKVGSSRRWTAVALSEGRCYFLWQLAVEHPCFAVFSRLSKVDHS
jgi:hypothetical protein